jgi:sulfate transporter 3
LTTPHGLLVACRLGFIIDFLSKATLVGFMAGAAIIVSLQQLKALMGIVHFTTEMGLVPVMASVFHHTKEWSWQTILIGLCFLVFLLAARHVVRTRAVYFFFDSLSLCAPLTVAFVHLVRVRCRLPLNDIIAAQRCR